MNFLRRSALLNLFFLLEAVISFLIDVTVAIFLGVSAQTDGLYAAWLVPQAIGRGIFQSLTNSFMGLFAADSSEAGLESAGDEASVDQVYSQAVTVIFIFVLPLTLLFSFSSAWWLPLTIPGATADVKSTAVPLAQILSGLIGCLAISETCRAIYYREDQMWWPSLSRIIAGLVAIGIVIIAGVRESLPIAAWGVLTGAAIEMILNFGGLRYLLTVRISLQWPQRAKLREMLSVVGLPISGLLVRTISTVVERALASLLGPGTVTLLSYVNRIINITERFVFRGFVVSTIRDAEKANAEEMRTYLRLMLFIALPICIAFATLSKPIVSILFSYGNFTGANVDSLALLLRYYSVAIFGIALTRIPLGKAYADTRSGVIFIFFVIVSIVLVAVEAALIYAGAGLAAFGIGYTAAILACLGWMMYAILRPLGVVMWRWPTDLLLLLTFLVTGIGTMLWVRFLNDLLPADAWWQPWALIMVGMGGSLLILTGTALVARLDEALMLLEAGRNTLRQMQQRE